jgi:hypothetical protein
VGVVPRLVRGLRRRGGAFNYGPERARSSNRVGHSPTLRVNSLGVRPARPIDP